MKALKNIVLGLIAIVALISMSSCAGSRYAEDMKYMKSSMERQMVASNEGGAQGGDVLYLSSVEDDEIVYPELTATEMANAKEVIADNGGKNVDVIIDNTGSRETVVNKSKSQAVKTVRDEETIYDVEDAVLYKKNRGTDSEFFKEHEKLFFYNALDHTVHKAECVGYNVLAEKNLTGFYAGLKGGAVYYNADFNPFAGIELGYNWARGNVRAFYSRAFQRKNGDDVNAGGSFEGGYYGVDVFRTFDLTPKGKLYDFIRLEVGLGISNLDRQLEYAPELNIDAPEDVEISIDGTIYQKGGVALPHFAANLKVRLANNWGLECGGMFAPITIEYRKGEARTATGGIAADAHISVIYFFNKWKKVRPSVASLAVARY